MAPTIPTPEQMQRLVSLSVQLNSTLNLDDLLQLIIRTAAELLHCEAASILLYDEKQPHLFFAATSDSNAEQLKQMDVPIEGSVAGTVFRTNRPMFLTRAGQDPRHYDAVSRKIGAQVRSLLAVPMRIHEQLTGVLEALNKTEGDFDEEDQAILEVIASHAAVAINNARLVQQLQVALHKAHDADQMKSDFLSLASHELRTPLGIIIGYATFLREDAQGELSEHAEQVLNSALKMRALVEDMTNLTLLKMDGLIFKAKIVSAQSILESAASDTQILANAKAQRLVYDMPESPVPVNVDTEKTASALVNILNNAIRFSPAGGQIILGARAEENGGLIWVQDNGIGIEADQLDNIFREFKQGEPPLTRRYGGLGLGLTIARGLITSQGGRVWAESAGPGAGATFKVFLPGAPT
ncbi:MAG: Sensor histidine kinase RcsC [Anaerolineales bacterium]|nr:Sensor histidine kinase RcsC [Anaerolineales bacterium]